MIDIILAIQLICGFSDPSPMDKLACEMRIHRCYREMKTVEADDKSAMKVCAVKDY